MTLIAVQALRDRAHILTDTLAYSIAGASFIETSKVTVLEASDLAVTAKGPTELAAAWLYELRAHGAGDRLDDVLDRAQDVLPRVWEQLPARQESREQGWLYNVGWSDARQRFVAIEHVASNGFEPVEIGQAGVFTNPGVAAGRKLSSDGQWVELGKTIYQTHAVRYDEPKHLLGGRLILTTLQRGSSSHRVLHRFPDDDWSFRKMVIGTLHPLGQIGPCACGSGQPQLVCHLAYALPGWPCPCTSGEPFDTCHRVEITDDVFRHWATHADDFHRSRDALRAVWRAEYPDDDLQPAHQIIKPKERT